MMTKFMDAGYTSDDKLRCICDRCRASGYYLISEIDDDGYFECHECHAPNYY